MKKNNSFYRDSALQPFSCSEDAQDPCFVSDTFICKNPPKISFATIFLLDGANTSLHVGGRRLSVPVWHPMTYLRSLAAG